MLSGGMGWIRSDSDPTKIQQRDTKIRPQSFEYNHQPCQACCWMIFILDQQKGGPSPCCQQINIAGFQDYVFDSDHPDADAHGHVKTCPGDTLYIPADTHTVPPYKTNDCGPPYPALNRPLIEFVVAEIDWYIVENVSSRAIVKITKVGNVSDDVNCFFPGGASFEMLDAIFNTIPGDMLYCPYTGASTMSNGYFGNQIEHA